MRRSLMWSALALSLGSSGVALAEPGEGSFTPTSLLVPIRKVTLEGSGAPSTLYSCDPTGGKDCLVDVADNTALAKLFAQPAAISVGTYDAVGVYNCGDEKQFTAKVKGSVLLSGATWYTAGGSVLSLDPADLDYVSVTYSGCKSGPSLAQPVAINEGDDVNISAFFTLANVAWVSSSLQPGSACALTPSGTARSVCVALPELVSYVGTAAPTVETYYVTEDQSDTAAAKAGGQVLLLVDGTTNVSGNVSGNVFGGFLRRLFSDTSRPPLVSYDAPLAGISVNADGTDYTAFTVGPTSGSYGVDFPAFQRQTHDGTFTWFGSTDAVPYRAVKK